jgi:CheY-like chemotaxis protein
MTLLPPMVLIVEDTPDIATMLHLAVARYGATSTVVGTGMAALHCLSAAAYAVLLTDYQLPDMTGAQLIAQVQQQPDLPCIILISGHSESSLAPLLSGLPITTYLSKPFPLRALFTALETCSAFAHLQPVHRGGITPDPLLPAGETA